MNSQRAVWGLDIGNYSLKALCCAATSDGGVAAESFDRIKHSKMLSLAGDAGERHQIVAETLGKFLTRNELRDDLVAISVPAQTGLARFVRLPPVEQRKIYDMVLHEARQQIPFPLEEVIWDYQQTSGGAAEGLSHDLEVGLFAMKRDQVMQMMAPLLDSKIIPELVQLATVCIHNLLAHEFPAVLPPTAKPDEAKRDTAMAAIVLGAETTDMVVSAGTRPWLRTVPVGGNHFTRAVAKELKLPFEQAEKLKRNAAKAKDPKRIFQAIRPVLNDLTAEIQRSLNFFHSIYRDTEISGVMLLGGPASLPGLKKFLAEHVGHKHLEFERFPRLMGDEIVGDPFFREHIHAFGACYGLCLQGLGRTQISTNLLPEEYLPQGRRGRKQPGAAGGLVPQAMAGVSNLVSQVFRWGQAKK